MRATDWINIAAVLLSPLVAVLVTVYLQRRRELRTRKETIFATLMAHRRAMPPERDWVRALNLIDVVFAGNGDVLNQWHQYYALLCSAKSAPEYALRDNKLLDLLTAMARDLGYKRLKQTEIGSYYSPQFYEDELTSGSKLRAEMIRVLENTSRIVTEPKSGGPQAGK